MEHFTGCAPEHIYDLFHSGCSGTVSMVNSRGIYLALGENLVLLCDDRFGVVPNGVALPQWERLPELFATGDPVQIRRMVLTLPSGSFRLELQPICQDTHISAPEAGALQSALEQLMAQARETGLSSLVYPLFAGERLPLNSCCQLALPLIQGLLQGLKAGDIPKLRHCVCSLLGLGPGLTPSGDDLLCGLLYGLRHSPARDSASCEALAAAIREFAPRQTNAISADYLLAVAGDAPFRSMAQAWQAPETGAAALMEIGSNSGGEMLLGLLCAGSIYRQLLPK